MAPTIRTRPGLLPLLNAGQPHVNENAAGNSQTQSSQRCPNGQGGSRNTSPYYPGAPTPGSREHLPAPAGRRAHVVISQLYGGGGNAGATYHNDYVELYNRGTGPVDLTRLVAAVRVGDWKRLGFQQAAARRNDRRRRVLPDRAGVGRRDRRVPAAGEYHRPDQHERHERQDRARQQLRWAGGQLSDLRPAHHGPRRLWQCRLPRRDDARRPRGAIRRRYSATATGASTPTKRQRLRAPARLLPGKQRPSSSSGRSC